MTNARELGKKAEDLAACRLRGRGRKLLARNLHYRGSELDLVLIDRGVLAFVEVRCRSSDRFGGALASVNHTKQQRIIRGAGLFLSAHPQYADWPCRFDIYSVAVDDCGKLHGTWHKGIFIQH